MQLTDYEQKVLAALSTDGGFLTGDVASRVMFVISPNSRKQSAAVRALLVGLERKGLVRRMDDQKPVCWVKV